MASDSERRWNRRPLFPLPSSNDRDKDRDMASLGPAAPLTHGDIAQALLDSPDEGRSLDFSRKNLGDVGESGAEELATIGTYSPDDECIVMRIALGSNRLATLPMAFALLSRLRYLNLRANNFTVFPDVLTVMPSLDVLDISRNKLKRLPSQPGTLLGLRVFSISKNRLTRLPEYISKATKLTVFQLDHNPFEWPPKHVLEPLENAEPDTMLSCIEKVKFWIDDHGSGSSIDRGKAPEIHRNPSDESPRAIHSSKYMQSELTSDESDTNANFSLAHNGYSFSTQHSRSFSTESDVSTYSTVSQESSGSEFPFHREHDDEMPKFIPSSNFSSIISSSLTSSPSISPTLPDHNVATRDPYNPNSKHFEEVSDLDDSLYGQQHGRNASYSVARDTSPITSHLSAKKSLPNLRGTNMTITDRPRNPAQRPRIPGMPTKTAIGISNQFDARDNHPPPPPISDRDEPSPRSGVSADTTQSHAHPSLHSRNPRSQPSNNHLRSTAGNASESATSPPMPSPKGPAPPMDVERNSYFRRLSTLPSSTVSATIPPALLAMIDSARGILFAVSQIYQSLRHYTVFAIDDRLSGLLGKVLDPASTYMTHLINALDRFDSISRGGLPSPAVCRGVLESCRDNVAVFGKVVGVLHLQLKVLAGSDDARYSRSLLLMLYGSMAEISNSWQTMVPHLDAIQPLLCEPPPPPSVSSSKIHIMTTPNTPSRNGIPPLPERQPLVSSPIPRTPSAPQSSNTTNGRSRMARRHAGSFSTRDVQIGKSLPSTSEEFPVPSVPSPSSTQPLRSALRKPAASPSLPHSQTSSVDSPSSSLHSRQGSSSPAVAAANSSYPLPFAHPSDTPSVRAPNSSLEVPSDSHKMVDEDLLNTMEAATETARSVWRMMDEVLHDTKETNAELLQSLESAQDITRRLKEEIRSMRGGNADSDRRAFWEDAHLFVKAVVNVSTILKAFSVSHPFSVILRSNIAKLTQSTQDFAILLQVSSFSPAPTPSPYSPAMPPTSAKTSAGSLPLSRSRSAQATPTPSGAKAKSAELRDVPWSALPHQTFKIPANP